MIDPEHDTKIEPMSARNFAIAMIGLGLTAAITTGIIGLLVGWLIPGGWEAWRVGLMCAVFSFAVPALFAVLYMTMRWVSKAAGIS